MSPSRKSTILELELKKVDLLYRQNVTGMAAILVNTAAFAYYSWGSISLSFIIPWFLALNFSLAIRAVAYRRWKKTRRSVRKVSDLNVWKRLMYACLLISGLGWGALGWVSAFGPPGEQVLAGLIISTMCAGAMITYVVSPVAMAFVVAPAMSIWSIGLITTGVMLNQMLGSLILFYCVLMVVMGKNLHRFVINALMLDVRLRKSEERLRMATDSLNSLTWDWDLIGDDFFWEGNLSLCPSGPDQLKKILEPFVRDGLDIDTEQVIKDKEKNYKYIAIHGRLYSDEAGIPYRYTGICWDITTKKNEQFLRQERDLHEAANKAKSILLANASHELRTPLAAIIGFSEALLRTSDLNEQGRRDVQSIFRQGHYMISLVNDLLDLSKIETNRLYIQKAAMSPAFEIEESISAIKNSLVEKHLSVELKYESKIPAEIQADAVRFRQVLINVLTNAVKFSDQGKIEVCVAVHTTVNNQATLKIQVRDHGVGIDDQTKSHIFEPFVRGEAPEIQKVQGSGLGLALSSSLMKMMNGELKLLSTSPREGSTFELSFDLGAADRLHLVSAPTLKSQAQNKLKILEEGAFLKGRRVLVVDDSVDLRLLMRRYLHRQGASVETSENGKEAVETALKDPFDIILMDIKMPIMDGYEATALLREKGYKKPIVALTAQASVDGQQKSYEMGFDGYLSKPVDIGLLKDILKDNAEFA